jgi:hypothetical protein
MSILYSKIKIEKFYITDDEPLETIWEHMREIKKGIGGIL